MSARSNLILKEISTVDKINTDLKPYVYLQTYRQWLDQFKFDYRVIPAFLAILVILAFIFQGPVNLGLFIADLLHHPGIHPAHLVPVLYGIIYQMTGLIFATFMAAWRRGVLYAEVLQNDYFLEFRNVQVCFAIISILIAP